ncbi:unnamed protein product [Malus baccata var. baccata]
MEAGAYEFAKNLAREHAQGCITGTIILLVSKGKSSHILRFNEELFFIYLLPPIIFNAGFQVKKKKFFQNFLTIMMFGVIGVFISVFIITVATIDFCRTEHFCMLLLIRSPVAVPEVGYNHVDNFCFTSIFCLETAVGTIFSSTDTVCTLQILHQDETPLLYSLVFGEGVVNDATSVVLFNAIQKIDVSKLNGTTGLRVIGDFLYLFFTSTALGIAFGLVAAYALKALCFGRHSSIREISLVVLIAYLSYMVAELFDLSGILTVFFCGILMSHYAWHNITEKTFIFLYVGMDALDIEKWKLTELSLGSSLGIYSTILMLILIGRAAFVFPLSAVSNYMNRRAERSSSISFKNQVIIWWAGLMRGAVSIALAFKQFTYSGVTLDPINATMITNTIIVVLFSTLVFGFLTKPLITYLLPHAATSNIQRKESKDISDDLNLPLLSFEESASTNISRAKDNLSMLMESPVHTIHSYWRRFDDAYMRPMFGGPIRNHFAC